MSAARLELDTQFPDASFAAWEALARDTLSRAKNSRTPDGVPSRALATPADWNADTGLPGAPPFTRGAAMAAEARAISIRSRITRPDPESANREIKGALAGGATSVLVVLDEAARSGDVTRSSGQGGVVLRTAGDVDALLHGLDVAALEIGFEAGASAVVLARLMGDVQAQSRPDLSGIRANLGHDCFGALARFGHHPGALDKALGEPAELAAQVRLSAPGLRVACIDATPYHGAGATPAQEIAIALAAGLAYLRAFDAAGLSLIEAAQHIGFRLVTDTDFFASIAKLRAFRRSWARVLEASGDANAALGLHLSAVTSPRMMAAQGPHTNLLRTTIAAAAAILGDADALTVLPFTERLGPCALARRLARNIGLILVEEADLARVIDPAGGAFAPEIMAEELAAAAWSAFQEIEREGGLGLSLMSGALQTRIAAAWDERRARIARRALPLIGVSEFAELAPSRLDLESALAPRSAPPAATSPFAQLIAGSVVSAPALVQHFDDEEFEQLRHAADAFTRRTGAASRIFIALVGTPADWGARGALARGAFAAGGIAAIEGPGAKDAGETAAAFLDSGARIAIIASSDALYAEHGPAFARAIKQAGARTLYVAGRPGSLEAAFRDAGVDEFLAFGQDLVRFLARAQEVLGVAR
jgi:methylmalonyl-CoA mutase